MATIDTIRRRFTVTVARMLRGQDVVSAGKATDHQRRLNLRSERDLVYIEVEVGWFGEGAEVLLYKQFMLEDSEGFLLGAEPAADYLDAALQPGMRARGGLLFCIYSDLAPSKLWFDTGQSFDDSGDPLLLDIALPAGGEQRAARHEALTRQLDVELGHSNPPQTKIESLLGQVSRELGLPYKRLANGYMFRVGLPGGRSQTVLMNCNSVQAGVPLIRFITLCAPARDGGSNHEVFLRLNATLAHGAIGITDIGQEPFYVVTESQLVATADSEELVTAIRSLASTGDELEARLTGGADVR
jgi:hypothetical protein